jgi:hypothetical protein
MFSNSSKLPNNITYTQIANVNDDEFLFCIDFPKFDFDFCCGCSLRTGVLMIGLFFILCGIGSLINVITAGTIIEYYMTITMLVIYSIAFLFLILSGFLYSYLFAYIAYMIYIIILFLNLFEIFSMTILIFLGFYTPAGSESRIVKGIGFLLVGMLLTCLYLYCLWIIFCFMIHLKYQRISLVNGDYNNSRNQNSDNVGEININENNYNLI